MYQVNIQNQLFSAALPLKPLTAWAGSACSVTVAVPPAPALAGLGVSSVGVTLTLPDGHTVAAAAVHVPGTPLWVATFAPDEFATSGHVAQGLMITVAGTDEHGVVRTWIVAKGDVDVMDGDAAPVSGGSYYAVKLRDAAPENPVEGDAYVSGGALLIYHDGEWVTIGGGGVVVDEEISASSPNPVRNSAIAAALADKQGALSPSQLAAVNSGVTSAKVLTWDGYAAQKANMADLPYRLVEPGKWEFSGVPTRWDITDISYELGYWAIFYLVDGVEPDSLVTQGAEDALSLTFAYSDEIHITATRPSLPGHLLDRAVNAMEISTATQLVLPVAVHGHARDLLVRLEIAEGVTPTITFAAPTGETIVYETDGDDFPVPDAAGVWLYSFTETAAHKFAVSLKKVTTVAQGGAS